MNRIKDITEWMNAVAPLSLSESWDNTGLLLGDPAAKVAKLQTCLTLTPESVDEAVDKGADLVVSHHPLPFKPLNKITTDNMVGDLVWRLASHSISIYSPHTSWDSAPRGINQQLAELLELKNLTPIIPTESQTESVAVVGTGRVGELPRPQPLAAIAKTLAEEIPCCRPRAVERNGPITRVAICCGSGGSLLEAAMAAGCDLFLTGEATFHSCLEAKYHEIGLLMIGHYASERFAMENLAKQICGHFPSVECWASESECDPVSTL